jgi:hypothetical protein
MSFVKFGVCVFWLHKKKYQKFNHFLRANKINGFIISISV